MKKLLLAGVVSTVFLFANAQSTMQENKGGEKSMAKKETMKHKKGEHVCTAACKDGKHVLAHGEKGHVCTDACHKKM